MSNSLKHKISAIILVILLFIHRSKTEKKCIKWTPKYVDHDGPSMIYTESVKPTDGIGTQLSIFAMLWMLRRSYNVDVFISKSCQETLSRVFTIESLSEIPVLEEFFCNPLDINFEYYSGDFEKIAKRKEFRNGRTMWLWPRTEILKPIMKSKGLNIEGDDYSSNFRGYNPIDHASGEAHGKLEKDYVKWMKRKLEFKPSISSRVKDTLETIAWKRDLRVSQMTFVGIHNRRAPGYIKHVKKYKKSKPFKKSYFYDGMEEMRESYGDNIAFLYVSDDMKWGRANIKDKENDLYFVGMGSNSNNVEVTTTGHTSENDLDPDDATEAEAEAADAFDFALLCSCNHTIITSGLFSTWGAKWTGGEYITEYGSIVPPEVNDAIEAETTGKESSFVYGANTGDPEGLMFPDLKIEGSENAENSPSSDSSWFFW